MSQQILVTLGKQFKVVNIYCNLGRFKGKSIFANKKKVYKILNFFRTKSKNNLSFDHP